MVEKAYAKINLALNVKDKREDGYHDIESIMLPLELHDSIELEISTNRTDDDFIVCDNYKVGISKYNLCHKAIQLAREKWKFKERFDVSIHKNIFLQSGLGGGSADAACVLRSVIKMLKLKVKNEELIEVASKIGADVPFMLFNKPSLVTGIGDVIAPFEFNSTYKDYYVLLCKPLDGISTTNIYNKYDELKDKKHYDINKIMTSLLNGDENLSKELGNSLEDAGIAIVPQIKEIKDMLIEKGFDMAFMTGGGSCVVGLTKNKKLAKKVLKEYYIDPNFECELTTFLKAKK